MKQSNTEVGVHENSNGAHVGTATVARSSTSNGVKARVIDLTAGLSPDQATEQIIESMKLDGACIVRGMIDREKMSRVSQDFEPHLRNASVWEGDFYPKESRRVTGCVGKSREFAISIVGNEIFQAVGRYFLSTQLQWNWIGTKNEQSTSDPQLSNTVIFSIQPGARKQAWHRDDDTHHNQQTGAKQHHLGRDTGMTMFVAGTKCTRLNGATRFIPGSHLWDYSVPPPPPAEEDDDDNDEGIAHANSNGNGHVKNAESVAETAHTNGNTNGNSNGHTTTTTTPPPPIAYVEMSSGDAFIMLSGVIHAAGANRTQDEDRVIYSVAAVRGWLRQEENQYLANDPGEVAKLPLDLQKFVGYALSRPSLGWVDFGDPIKVLRRYGGDDGEGEGKGRQEGVEDMF